MVAGNIEANASWLRSIANSHMEEGGLYVYDREVMEESAKEFTSIEMPFGHTVRFAAKANPHRDVISHFDRLGLHFDASSVYEAEALVNMGVEGSKISLSSQVLRDNSALADMLEAGVLPVATSLRQLVMLGGLGVKRLGVRINTEIGSGHNPQTNVGGSTSAFGIWHEQINAVKEIAAGNRQIIDRLHMHIGSGADPDVWRAVMSRALSVVDALPEVTSLDIGGGFKVARTPKEEAEGYHTDMSAVGNAFAEEMTAYAFRTGREVRLETEPGTRLVARAGILLTRIEEIKTTDAHQFLIVNAGMNALLRPSHYGSQHPMEVLNDSEIHEDYVVMGPACESGDLMTPLEDQPGVIKPVSLKLPKVGDILAIGGAGAYGQSMAAIGYNHLPRAKEIVI